MAANFAGRYTELLVAKDVALRKIISTCAKRLVLEFVVGLTAMMLKTPRTSTMIAEPRTMRQNAKPNVFTLFVHIAQDVDAQHDHSEAKHYEPMLGTEERPVAVKVRAEDSHLGDGEEDYSLSDARLLDPSTPRLTADAERDHMADSIEEEEL